MRLGLVGIALLTILLIPAAGHAASAQAGATEVTSARVLEVDGRVVVDVVVSQPDARAANPSRQATNTGALLIALHDGDGQLLASRSDESDLPVAMPGARAVEETYRIKLSEAAGARVLAAVDLQVDVVAETRLDANGPGDGGVTVSTDTESLDANVKRVDQLPAEWHPVFFSFATGPFCYIAADECMMRPWHHDRVVPQVFADDLARVDIRYTSDPSWEYVTLATPNSFVRGTTAAKMGSDRLSIEDGVIPSEGAKRVFGNPDKSGQAGQRDGPLHMDIESDGYFHNWEIYGYLAYET